LRIGGLQKQSFIDFPGRISCVVFLAGCNFACPYCHNPRLVKDPGGDPQAPTVASVLEFLERRRGFLEGVVISGGEPTLNRELPEFCRRIKGLGYVLKLDTNGSRPRVLKGLIAGQLVDYIAMDVKTEPERYAGCLAADCAPGVIQASVRLLMSSGVDYEFRTTCVKPLVTAETIAAIARMIAGSRRYALQPFRGGGILRPDFFEGVDPAFSASEMEGLRRIAAPRVGACTLR
jgi:pyruvate formate lyase activating enzyme